jgi:DUF4097 and DUF4098 domain-containing protein YvlB
MTRKNHRVVRLAIAAAATILTTLTTVDAAQERPVNETRPASATAQVTIENMAGLIDVSGWDRNEVQVTGTLDEQASKLEISGNEHALRIEVKYQKRHNLSFDNGSRLTIKVPRGSEVETESVSAEIKIAEVAGEVSCESVSGRVTVRGAPAGLDVETVSGAIDVAITAGDASLASVSGDILAKGVSGDVEATTVSGEIEISASGPLSKLTTESVSGSMAITATPTAAAKWSLSAHSGDVDLAVPADVNAGFTIGTFSGSIRDGFGHEATRADQYAPGRELNFTQGKGGAEIEVESFSGDVVIRNK